MLINPILSGLCERVQWEGQASTSLLFKETRIVWRCMQNLHCFPSEVTSATQLIFYSAEHAVKHYNLPETMYLV